DSCAGRGDRADIGLAFENAEAGGLSVQDGEENYTKSQRAAISKNAASSYSEIHDGLSGRQYRASRERGTMLAVSLP
ncbi:MAG: hypothetical protein WBX06_15630, partial [Acidobacteriaceae bacterium]